MFVCVRDNVLVCDWPCVCGSAAVSCVPLHQRGNMYVWLFVHQRVYQQSSVCDCVSVCMSVCEQCICVGCVCESVCICVCACLCVLCPA